MKFIIACFPVFLCLNTSAQVDEGPSIFIDTLNQVAYRVAGVDTIRIDYTSWLEAIEQSNLMDSLPARERKTDYSQLPYDTSLIVVRDASVDRPNRDSRLAESSQYVPAIHAFIEGNDSIHFKLIKYDLLLLDKKKKTVHIFPGWGKTYPRPFSTYVSEQKKFGKKEKSRLFTSDVWLEDNYGNVVRLRKRFPLLPKEN